jgi:hypothetical protein
MICPEENDQKVKMFKHKKRHKKILNFQEPTNLKQKCQDWRNKSKFFKKNLASQPIIEAVSK